MLAVWVSAETRCGIESTEIYEQWMKSFTTQSLMLFPTTESELATIFDKVYRAGCRVRIAGTAHTEDGAVVQKPESRSVVVVSLWRYRPPAEWDRVLDRVQQTYRCSAGASELDVIADLKPEGYLLHTHTAGRFFTIGGTLLNPSVHGGMLGEGRMSSMLIGLRAMLSNGSIVEIFDDIHSWRGSMGMLGAVLSVEIRIKRDNGLVMGIREYAIKTWRRAPLDSIANFAVTHYDGVEWFYDVYNDVVSVISASADADETFDLNSTRAHYNAMKAIDPDLARSGGHIASLFSGLARIETLFSDLRELSKMVAHASWATVKASIPESNNVRDGFWVSNQGLLPFDQVHIFLKCETDCIADGKMFLILDKTRTFLKEIIDSDSDWYPTLGVEWRLVDISTDLLLEHLHAGKYISFEIVSIRDIWRHSNVHGRYFQQLENMWMKLGATRMHHGKSWGYDQLGDLPSPYPFRNESMIEKMYTPAVRAAFLAKMDHYDPMGLFRAGAVMHYLGAAENMFDVRSFHLETCSVFGFAQCFEGCCDTSITSDYWGKCFVPKQNSKWCSSGCDCRSGRCLFRVCY